MTELVAERVPIRGGYLDVFDNGDFVVHRGDPAQPETHSTYYQHGQGPREIREPVDRFLARRAQAHAESPQAQTGRRLEDMYVVDDPRGTGPAARLTGAATSALQAMERGIARERELRQPVPYPSSGGESTVEEGERERRGQEPPLTQARVERQLEALRDRVAAGTLSPSDYAREARALAQRYRAIQDDARLRGYHLGQPGLAGLAHDLAEWAGLESPLRVPDEDQLRRERYVEAQVRPMQTAAPLGSALVRELAWLGDLVPLISTLNDLHRLFIGVDPTTMEPVSAGGRAWAGAFAVLDLIGGVSSLLGLGSAADPRLARMGLSRQMLQRTRANLEVLRHESHVIDAAVRRARAGQDVTARELELIRRLDDATHELRQALRPVTAAPPGVRRIEGMPELPARLQAVSPRVARRAMAGRRAPAGRSGGAARIADAAGDAIGAAAARARISVAQARRRLRDAHDDVIDFVNRFHAVPGFEQVLADYLRQTRSRGRGTREGARYAMQFISANVRQPVAQLVAQGRIAFEAALETRVLDALIENVRYEFKSVLAFRPGGRHGLQLRRDLADLLAQMPDSPEHLRWVFDANQLAMTRTELVELMRQTVRRSFAGHPRAADLERWIETIVIVW